MAKKEKTARRSVEFKKKPKWISVFVILAIILLIAVLINMAIIFYFSEESVEASGDRSSGIVMKIIYFFHPDYDDLDLLSRLDIMRSFHHAVRKLAHFTEFGLLGFLSTGLVLYVNCRKHWVKPWLEWCLPTVFCLLYAASDEIHQIFSNRGASVKDVMIDFAGAVTGILLMRAIIGIVRAAKRRRERRKCETPVTD
jgi:VanZ family protein